MTPQAKALVDAILAASNAAYEEGSITLCMELWNIAVEGSRQAQETVH